MIKKKQHKQSSQLLREIKELLEKLVYLNECQFKSAGVNIKYPERGKEKNNEQP